MNISRKSLFRLFDANINRATEGIRVLEDTARMLLDDEELTRTIKDIRHSLIQTVKIEKNLSRSLLHSRGSETDVLRSGETAHERTRNDVLSVVEANAGRAQEALRALEEFGKLLYPVLSERFKNIRFRLYDVEKLLAKQVGSRFLASREQMGIVAILDRSHFQGSDIVDITLKLIHGGAGTIAYRDTVSSDGEFLIHAGRFLDACSGKEVTAIMCDRIDCAMILGAEGILLQESGVSVKDCRELVGPDCIIGYTMNLDVDDGLVIDDDADYVVIESGPGTDTMEKKAVEAVIELRTNSQKPVIIQGDLKLSVRQKMAGTGLTGF
ncbi:thiamine phosphate synthase, partial [Candidatus Omnitrophota bacterium]